MKLRELVAEPRRARVVHVAVAHVIAACALVLMGLLAGGAGRYVESRQAVAHAEVAEPLDAGTVAIVPFRVTADDASLEYLRDGMVDLLALKLTGVPAAADPRATLAAWGSDDGGEAEDRSVRARRLGRRLRAGMALHGSIVGSGDGSMTLTVSLLDVASGDELATATESGTADELTSLIDRVTGAVLGGESAEPTEELAALTSTSLPALRAYLTGEAHYRRGQYEQAVESYGRALELDSTFALAALRVLDPATLAPEAPGDWQTRGRELLRAHRDRLTLRDRDYADARWLADAATSVAAELERLERVAHDFPDRPEAWYHYADLLYREGGLAGDGEQLERARVALERALALDSTHAIVLRRLLAVADRAGDTALLSKLQPHDPAASAGDYAHRLRAAHWRGDTIAVRDLLAGLDTLDVHALTGVVVEQQLVPRPAARLDFARRAAELLAQNAKGAAERHNALLYRYQIEMNAGRPHDARRLMDSVPPPDRLAWDRRRIYDAVYWDGDSAAAAASAQRVERYLRGVARGPLTDRDALALCALTSLRLARGATSGAERAIERLRVPHRNSRSPLARRICALNLAAVLAHREEAPDAEARLLELDSLLRTGPLVPGFREHANISAARLFEARGDVPRALAASRRRLVDAGGQSYASTFLELECRLAAAAGERDAAQRACTRYLALRSDPEPSLAEKAAQARAYLEQGGAQLERSGAPPQ